VALLHSGGRRAAWYAYFWRHLSLAKGMKWDGMVAAELVQAGYSLPPSYWPTAAARLQANAETCAHSDANGAGTVSARLSDISPCWQEPGGEVAAR